MPANSPRPWRNVVLGGDNGQQIGVPGNPLVVSATITPGADPIPVTNSESLDDGDPNTAQPVLMGAEAQDDPDNPGLAANGSIIRLLANRARTMYASLAGIDGGGGSSVVAVDPVGNLTSEGRVGAMVHDASLGVSTDAAVTTDAAGTVNAHIRGLLARAASTALGLISRVVDSAGGEVLGLTTSAAVTTDANGSLAAWLRGLVTLMDGTRFIAPVTGDVVGNQAVTTGAVITFAVTAARKYVITPTVEVTFIEGTDPTATTGMILPAGVPIGPIEADAGGGTFRFIATTASGRVSVVQVYP